MADFGDIGFRPGLTDRRNGSFGFGLGVVVSGFRPGLTDRRSSDAPISTGAVTLGRLGRNLLGPNHKITGTARIDGALVPNRKVWLIERASGRVIAQTFSNAAGAFEFGNLWSGNGAMYAVYMLATTATDPVRNAQIFDFVTATP